MVENFKLANVTPIYVEKLRRIQYRNLSIEDMESVVVIILFTRNLKSDVNEVR